MLTPACGSPGLIAACHVLHRLLLPRHPPCALSSLTIKFTDRTALTGPRQKSQVRSPACSSITALTDLLTSRLGTICVTRLACRFFPIYSVVKHRPPGLRRSPPQRLRYSSRCSMFSAPGDAQHRTACSFALPATGHQDLVELTGIEPVTPCLQSRCSPS